MVLMHRCRVLTHTHQKKNLTRVPPKYYQISRGQVYHIAFLFVGLLFYCETGFLSVALAVLELGYM